MLAPEPKRQLEQDKEERELTEAAAPRTTPTEQQKQAKMLAAYRLQQQRMRCPGCGEGDEIF